MNIEQIIHAIITGEIPSDLEMKTRALLELAEFQRLAPTASAVLLSAARRDNFESPGEWLTWAREKFSLDDSYIHQLRKIGDMLLAIQENEALYKRLFRVSFNNLLPLTQLDYESNGSGIDCLEKFLEINPVEEMTREQVRDAVALALGRVSKSGGNVRENKWQPDLFEAIDVVCETASKEMYLDDRFDGAAASKYFQSGMLLIDNVVSFFDVHGAGVNPVQLCNAEQMIRNEADKLLAIRERLAAQEQAG